MPSQAPFKTCSSFLSSINILEKKTNFTALTGKETNQVLLLLLLSLLCVCVLVCVRKNMFLLVVARV